MHYFEPCLDWQQPTWDRVTTRFPDVAHALLIAGMQGTGKQRFAQQLAAWVLCQQAGGAKSAAEAIKDIDDGGLFGDMPLPEPAAPEVTPVACGDCESCHWLRAGTHPQFLHIKADEDSKSDIIKVDTIRQILPFTQQSSQGFRVVFIEQAHNMNVSAANALLKTLEEPAKNVLMILTSDQPQRLLPTIRSRVQALAVSQVTDEQAIAYVKQQQPELSDTDAAQMLTVAGGAPLLVNDMVDAEWYNARHTWIKVWQALRAGQRNPMAASQFWQAQKINIADVLRLHTLVCRDLLALYTETQPVCADVSYATLSPQVSVEHLEEMLALVLQFQVDLRQNVQPALVFDLLMQQLSLV